MVMGPGPTGAPGLRVIRSDASSTEAVAVTAVPSTITSAEVTANSAPCRAMEVTGSCAVASIATSPVKVAVSRSGASRSS